MKKSNWIIMAVVAVVSVFLLWLWFYLGFNKIDSPLDLLLSIIWWLIVAIGIFGIIRVESARRKRVRTIYVGNKAFFNSEKGITYYREGDEANFIEEVEKTLDNLAYNFKREDYPETDELDIAYIIRSDVYKAQDEKDEKEKDARTVDFASYGSEQSEKEKEYKWEGEVVISHTGTEFAFASKEELVQIVHAVGLPKPSTQQPQKSSGAPTVIEQAAGTPA